MRTISIACAVLAVAAVAQASNTGFKLTYALRQAPAGASGSNWVSPPYYFFPDGDSTNPDQTAEDWCTDLNGGDPAASSPVQSLARFDTNTDTFLTKFCVGPTRGFTLTKGEGYAVKLDFSASDSTPVAIVGSHDDAYAGNKGGTETITLIDPPLGRSGSNWVSIPYHVMANDGEELCTMVNGGDPFATEPVESIARFDTLTDTFFTKFCIGPIGIFPITPGESLAFRTGGVGNQQIQFDVY